MKSRSDLNDPAQEAAEQQLYIAFASLRNPEEAQAFLRDLCTPAELQAMWDRLQVIGPIKQDIPYRTIHEQTGVSVTTIGRVARCLKFGTGGYNAIFERLQKKLRS